MTVTTDKTEATTKNITVATENTNEAVTTETELTAEQKIEAKIEAKYGAKALAGRKSIKAIVNELENGKNQLTMNTLSLGYTLVDTYINFLNEEREHFWEIVDTKTRSQKTMERAIKLVIEQNVELSEAMDTTGGTEDIEENVKLLTLDKRMFNLYNDNLSNVKKPTIAKIRNMKGLSLEDWDKTCSGKSDKPYNAYMKEQGKLKDKADKKVFLQKKPPSMREKIFESYYKVENITLIEEIADNGVEIATLKEKIVFLEKLMPVSTSDKGYMVSNETESEKV